MKSKYAILTVDTEALPNRASDDHVNRLILGKHGGHQAGVMEMADIGREFGAPLVFFLDFCGAWSRLEELGEVARQLDAKGQDVQLHAHPEYLPITFWQEHKLDKRPYYLNEYPQERADFMLSLLASTLEGFTGKKPRAFRSGSFRWNKAILSALEKIGVRYSFNNSMCAIYNGQCPFSLPTNHPYRWSNGLVEIPVSEKQIFSFINPTWWARLQYPQSRYYRLRRRGFNFLPGGIEDDLNPAVFLIHSWSFLRRNKEGYQYYDGDGIMDGFRKFLRQLTLDYDVIVTTDLDDLIARGEISISHTEDIEKAAVTAKSH